MEDSDTPFRMMLPILCSRILLLLWLYSFVTSPITANGRRPWSFPNTIRHGSTTDRPNLERVQTSHDFHDVPSFTNPSTDHSTMHVNKNSNTASDTSEYVVVCILGVGGSISSPNSTNTVALNFACILIEMIPPDPSRIATKHHHQQQPPLLRYHYYPNLLHNMLSTNEALPIVWQSIGLLSDVIVLHVDTSRDNNVTNDHTDLVRALVTGLQQRNSAKLSPSSIYIIVSASDTLNDERAQQLYHELHNATTSELVHRITIIHGSDHDNITSSNLLVDISIPQPKEDGSHTLTDCSSFIHVLHETILRWGYKICDPQQSLHSFADIESHDAIIIHSIPSTVTPTTDMTPPIDSVPNEGIVVGETEHPPRTFLKFRKPKISNIPLMRNLLSLLPRNIMKSPAKPNINEHQSDDLQEDFDRIYQQLRDIQNQQEDYVLLLIDSQHVVAFDLIPMMNPIMDQLHTVLSCNRYIASEELNMFGTIHQQLITIYEYQCNTILRNYYGTLYETIFDQQPLSSLSTKWVHALQDRVRENYRRDVEQILRSLERHDNAFMSFSKKQQQSINSLDINKLVTNFMSDVQDITELRMDVSALDNDEHSQMMMNDILHPRQYKNRLRRQRLYRWSKNVMKRVVMIGINYIQGYIAIQSIKYIALQQEREMPKFPLF